MLSNDPTPIYAPLAIRQNPAKNRSIYQPNTRQLCATIQTANGAATPKRGPAQTTKSGFGFTDTSVREMVKGWSTTRSTLTPVSQAPRTWPASCTAIMANQDNISVEQMRMI